MSAFGASPYAWGNPILGGYDLGISSVVQDYGLEKDVPDPAKPKPAEADKPLERPYTPYGYSGQWPGYGPYPMVLTLAAAWQMRRYPMVCKVYGRIANPILAGKRVYEIEDDGGDPKLAEEILEAASYDLLPALNMAVDGALESCNFGHFLQELVWGENDKGRTTITDITSILPGEATIHVDKFRRFAGYQFMTEYRDPRYGFLCVNEPKFDRILGRSFAENALTSWFRATQSASNADAIEKKASGIQMFLHIMEGTQFNDPNTGQPLKPGAMAAQWLNNAVTGGSAIVPAFGFDKKSIQANPDLANIPHVKIDRFDWGTQGENIRASTERQHELDVMICSAYDGIPERAVMESQHGDKGDAGEHSDVVDTVCEKHHWRVVNQWHMQTTGQWMAENFPGAKVKIRPVALAIQDPDKKFKQEVFVQLLSNPETATEAAAQINVRKTAEGVELPLKSVEDAAAAVAASEQKKKDEADKQAEQMKAKAAEKKPGAAPKKEAVNDE